MNTNTSLPAVQSGESTPGDAIEALVCRLAAEVLALDRVDPADDFFAIGGTSLTAKGLLSRVSARLGVEVGIDVLFDTPRLSDFAAIVAGHNRLEPADDESVRR